jgi:hypothetical protein
LNSVFRPLKINSKEEKKKKEKRRETEKKETKNFGGLVCVAQHSGGCLVEEINDQSEASKK